MKIAAPGWQILYGGTNITSNLQPHATHIEYHESISGKASSLQIYLEDASGRFQNNPPDAGAAVSLSLGYADSPLVSCGLFEVDEWEFNGPPDLFVLRCIQAGITHAIRTPKSVAYENQTLISIATTIAGIYGMTVVADAVVPDVTYARLTQKLESDLAFLHRIANLHNYDFNVRGNQLVFYSRPQLESKPSVGTIEKADAMRFHLRKQHVGSRSYATGVSIYFDPLSKKLVQALATDPNAVSVDTLKIVERLENKQQAALRAQSHLHVSNMHQIKAEIDIPGTMLYRAGNPVTLSGFGAFDGVKFIVEEAHHQVSRAGYKTMLHLRTTVSGGAAQIISNEYED